MQGEGLQGQSAVRSSVVVRRDAPPEALPHASRCLRAGQGRDAAGHVETGGREVWEPKFIGEIVSGRDPRKPPAPPAAEGMTVADFLDQYYERYVIAESLRSVASIRSRLAALKEALGTLAVGALERIDTIEDFKRDTARPARSRPSTGRSAFSGTR